MGPIPSNAPAVGSACADSSRARHPRRFCAAWSGSGAGQVCRSGPGQERGQVHFAGKV